MRRLRSRLGPPPTLSRPHRPRARGARSEPAEQLGLLQRELLLGHQAPATELVELGQLLGERAGSGHGAAGTDGRRPPGRGQIVVAPAVGGRPGPTGRPIGDRSEGPAHRLVVGQPVELAADHPLELAGAPDVVDDQGPVLVDQPDHQPAGEEHPLPEVLAAVDLGDPGQADLDHVTADDPLAQDEPAGRHDQARAQPPGHPDGQPGQGDRHHDEEHPGDGHRGMGNCEAMPTAAATASPVVAAGANRNSQWGRRSTSTSSSSSSSRLGMGTSEAYRRHSPVP